MHARNKALTVQLGSRNHQYKDGRYPEIMQSSLFYLSSLCSRFPCAFGAYSLETMGTPSKVRANVT